MNLDNEYEMCSVVSQIEKEYKQIDWSLCTAQYVKHGLVWPCIQKMGHDHKHVDCNGNEF